jgi:hypothetical protein
LTFACATHSFDGGKRRFSCRTDSMLDMTGTPPVGRARWRIAAGIGFVGLPR